MAVPPEKRKRIGQSRGRCDQRPERPRTAAGHQTARCGTPGGDRGISCFPLASGPDPDRSGRSRSCLSRCADDRLEIVNILGVRPEDVSRLLPLALLSPRILKAIPTGLQPVDLSARYLMPDLDLPVIWVALHQMLGV